MNSKYSHVFTPIRVRGITFKNRIYLAETNTKMKTLEDIDVEIKVKQT